MKANFEPYECIKKKKSYLIISVQIPFSKLEPSKNKSDPVGMRIMKVMLEMRLVTIMKCGLIFHGKVHLI